MMCTFSVMGQALAGRGGAANGPNLRKPPSTANPSQLQHGGPPTNPVFQGDLFAVTRRKSDSAETFGWRQNPCKIACGIAVKSFGNSQKGIGKGWLTCVYPS